MPFGQMTQATLLITCHSGETREREPMTTMKAIRAHVRGGPEVLVYEDAPVPEVGPDELLLEVYAAAITFTELLWDETWLRDGEPRTPTIPSHEASGRIIDVGADVVGYKKGDEVFGLLPFDRNGAAAQFTVLPSDCVAHKPAGIDHVNASALPLAALTAWQALVDHGHVTAGSRVLILGAAGGVGQFAVQIARLLGAHVTATARGKDIALLASLGADRTIDFENDELDGGGREYDVVLYSVPGAPDERLYGTLNEGGVLVTLNAPADAELLEKHKITGAFFIVRADSAQMEHLSSLVADGHLSVRVAARFPLEEARRAYESGHDPHREPGKVVLTVRT
ncbi:NADP-dependent oxidoreductase [Glaciibacter sp. 2TAF33]|uniref:NADP-dependent oxidoreductase n=1 Tax=Glaciibacter sp. 2TAF33 TaxID=3233015 RepID=UPI003F90B415